MKLARFFLLSGLAFSAAAAHAQEVLYTLSGTYGLTVPTTTYTAPGQSFAVLFEVPAAVANSSRDDEPFSLSTPIRSGAYTLGGKTITANSGQYGFFANADDESLISLVTPSATLSFGSLGPGNTLDPLADRPDAAGLSHFLTGDLGTKDLNEIYFTPWPEGPFYSATVHVTGSLQPVAEPSTLALMVTGLLSCGGFAWVRYRRPVA